jgi:hypothetical protein
MEKINMIKNEELVIKIKTTQGELSVKKYDEHNKNTLKIILDNLPIEGIVNTWGDEIYFETELEINEEKTQREVEIGELAFWPPGKAICIFFGKTPISESNKPKAASPVNVFGKIIESEINILSKLKNGERISLEISK